MRWGLEALGEAGNDFSNKEASLAAKSAEPSAARRSAVLDSQPRAAKKGVKEDAIRSAHGMLKIRAPKIPANAKRIRPKATITMGMMFMETAMAEKMDPWPEDDRRLP